MTPITILGLIMLALAVWVHTRVGKTEQDPSRTRKLNNVVLQLGIFAFFTGILSQTIGLMQAFQVIQAVEAISPTLLAGGLYVSMIAPVWGLILLMIGFVAWSAARYRMK